MTQNKTVATDEDVAAYLEAIQPERRRVDGLALDALFRDVTGYAPQIWRGGIIGYGTYQYRYDSGREGSFLATGFALRKTALTLYIMPGYADLDAYLSGLGKYKTGKACLYINKLADVDMGVLRDLIAAGLADLKTRWPVTPF